MATIEAPPRGGVSKLCALLLFVGLCGVVGKFVADHAYCLYDDAYIYMRYARNVAAGCGLRWNCDEAPVEGFTGPLYLAALVAGQRLVPDLETLSQVLGALFLTGALLGTALAALRRTPGGAARGACLALGAAFLLGADHYILLNAVIGLETALACLVLALLAAAALSERLTGLRCAVVLAILTRPEAALFALLLPLLPRARSLRYLAPLCAALGAVALARLLLFHDVLPNTYFAKSGGTYLHAVVGWRYLRGAVASFPVILLAPLALLRRDLRPGAAYLLAAALLWLAFFLRSGGDTFNYSRLAVPLVPPLTLLSLLGVLAAFDGLAAAAARRRPFGPLGALGPAAALTVAGGAGAYAAVAHHAAPMHGFRNVREYAAVGRYLAEHHRGQSVAAVPIGAIGYLSGLKIIDLVGLTSREVARAGRTVPPEMMSQDAIGHERHNTEWVLSQRPDLIVTTTWRTRRAAPPPGRPDPWDDPRQVRSGIYAEQLLLREVAAGRAPYRVYNAEVAPGMYWILLQRTDRDRQLSAR